MQFAILPEFLTLVQLLLVAEIHHFENFMEMLPVCKHFLTNHKEALTNHKESSPLFPNVGKFWSMGRTSRAVSLWKLGRSRRVVA